MQNEMVLGVSEFVDYVNQTLEAAYPFIGVEGELSNFRVSRGKWVYFDLKDEVAIVKCFMTVYALSGPLEDGMVVRVHGSPRLHPLYNFTFNAQSVVPVGEGNLRKQADLLRAKLEAEGLFDVVRKRQLPSYPKKIALVAAGQSAAYADFVKIARARWVGLTVDHFEVQVQGEQAPMQIVGALQKVSAMSELPDAVVITRGGGSAEDLAAFNDERVVRAIAASRVPTVVAIGHEIDLSLAEMAADLHASTPSNAAELLLPDAKSELRQIASLRQEFDRILHTFITHRKQALITLQKQIQMSVERHVSESRLRVESVKQLLRVMDPKRPLALGYALLRDRNDEIVKSVMDMKVGDVVQVELTDGKMTSQVQTVVKKGERHDKSTER